MNDILSNTIDNHCAKFNTNITNGKVKDIMKWMPQYLDGIFRSSIKSLSPNVPLTYIGYEKLTPDEEFFNIIIGNNSKPRYDIAVSDMYSIKFIFDYNGEPIVKSMYLPFGHEGNLITISNNKYTVINVLSDTVISPSTRQVFVRLLKNKLTFKSVQRNFLLNNEKVPGHIIYTTIVNVKNLKIKQHIGKVHTPISLYLLGQYGIKETFRRYCNTEDVIVTIDNVDNLRDKYNVYESTKIKVPGLKTKNYVGHDVKICINKSVPRTTFMDNFIFGLIYAIDILPQFVDNIMPHIVTNNVELEKFNWRVLLGKITYNDTFTITRIVEDMEEHFDTLQGYLDNLTRNQLLGTELGLNKFKLDNFFDLLAIILEEYNTLVVHSKEYNSNIHNRYIDILYYLMFDIFYSFNKVILNINKRASKQKEILSYKEVNKIMADIKLKTIYQLVKSKSPNLAIQLTEATSDIMYPKVTCLLDDRTWSLTA